MSPDPEAPAPTPPDPDACVRFVLELGLALHRYGTPANRLEDVMAAVSLQLGLTARLVSTPTAIYASFGAPEALKTTLIRADPGEVDLDRLSQLDRVTSLVLNGQLLPAQGAAAVDAILAQPPRYGPWVTVGCNGLVAAAGAQLFGGGLKEIGVSLGIGLLLGALALAAGRLPSLARGYETIAAFIAAAISVALTRLLGHFSSEVTTLASLVFLLPGLTLTVAMIELATKNLISGTSRFMGALLVFLQLAFGVALAPFFVFDVYFYAVKPVLTEIGLLDLAGNLVMLIVCWLGWRRASAR